MKASKERKKNRRNVHTLSIRFHFDDWPWKSNHMASASLSSQFTHVSVFILWIGLFSEIRCNWLKCIKPYLIFFSSLFLRKVHPKIFFFFCYGYWNLSLPCVGYIYNFFCETFPIDGQYWRLDVFAPFSMALFYGCR